MKGLKTVGVGLMVVGLLIAIPVAAIAINLTVAENTDSTTGMNAAMTHMSAAGGMGAMGGSTVNATPVADQLTIVHRQKGCHDWSMGTAQVASMHLTMKPGQMLRVMNQDVDMHQLREVSGPARMMTGGPMKEGQADSLTFKKPGIYRFDTKVLPMKGMPEVETIGPDNHLRLTVTVT